MTLLLMVFFTAAFITLAILTGGNGNDHAADIEARRRMRVRLARGGFPAEGWEVF